MSSAVHDVDLVHKSKKHCASMVCFTFFYWEVMATKFPTFWGEDFWFFMTAVTISGFAIMAQWLFFVNWYNEGTTDTSKLSDGMFRMLRCVTVALLGNRGVDFVITYFTGREFEHMRSVHLMMGVSLLMNALTIVFIIPNLIDKSNHPSDPSQPPPPPEKKEKEKKEQ